MTRKVLTELRTNVDEKGVRLSQESLTVSTDLRKLGLLLMIAPSSNGKTADSGSAYRGSNPCGAARAAFGGPNSEFRVLNSEFSTGLIV